MLVKREQTLLESLANILNHWRIIFMNKNLHFHSADNFIDFRKLIPIPLENFELYQFLVPSIYLY